MLIMADFIAICIVADVKTTVADVIACCFCFWLMFLPLFVCGRCYNHYITAYEEVLLADVVAISYIVVDVITTEADVVACFCFIG